MAKSKFRLPSFGTLATLGVVGVSLYAIVQFGGFRGIGDKITGGLSSLGNSIIGQSNAPDLGGILPTKTSAEQIVNTVGIQDQVTNIPSSSDQTVASQRQRDITKGSLVIAGLLESEGLAGKIDLQTGVFENQFTRQPLDFAIGEEGVIKTGRAGLGDATLKAQAALAKKFGIPTFDIDGNISTFGRLVTSN